MTGKVPYDEQAVVENTHGEDEGHVGADVSCFVIVVAEKSSASEEVAAKTKSFSSSSVV